MSFEQDAELAALNYGTVRPVDVAHNTRPDPAQAVRLTVWESSTVYLTIRETELIIAALQRSVDKVRSLEE